MIASTNAQRLNSHCTCLEFEPTGVLQQFSSEHAFIDWWHSCTGQHDHLFAATAVFITPAEWHALQGAVLRLHSEMSSVTWRDTVLPKAPAITQHDWGTQGAFMGYDFHLQQGVPQLIEINTNAGGAYLNLVLARTYAQTAHSNICDTAIRFMPLEHLERDWCDMFAAEWAAHWQTRRISKRPLFDRTGSAHCIAIVDQHPSQQFLYPEFLLFQNLFNAAGANCLILAPEQLAWDAGQLSFQGQVIDMVYLRLTDFYLQELVHAALRAAYESGDCVFTPSPHHHALRANKAHLVALSQSTQRTATGAPATLRSIVPETVLLTADNAAQLWQQRQHYFFKPLLGYGAKAAYRGDKLTQKTWAQIQQADYVAQVFVEPNSRLVSTANQRQTLKFDLRAYVWRDQIQLLAARIYQGQTTNFRTAGGGFAPIFLVD